VISRGAILLLVSMLAGLAGAWRKRRVRLLGMKLLPANSPEAFHREVLRLKHYRVLRPNAIRRNAGFISLNKSEFAAIYKRAPK